LEMDLEAAHAQVLLYSGCRRGLELRIHLAFDESD
jgi:hypothetical protein